MPIDPFDPLLRAQRPITGSLSNLINFPNRIPEEGPSLSQKEFELWKANRAGQKNAYVRDESVQLWPPTPECDPSLYGGEERIAVEKALEAREKEQKMEALAKLEKELEDKRKEALRYREAQANPQPIIPTPEWEPLPVNLMDAVEQIEGQLTAMEYIVRGLENKMVGLIGMETQECPRGPRLHAGYGKSAMMGKLVDVLDRVKWLNERIAWMEGRC
jgi:hypothetical protein